MARHRSALSIRFALCAFLLLPTVLFAQPAEPAQTPPSQERPAEQTPPPPRTDEPPQVLEEIVVTAQKRQENVQDVPAAVTAVSDAAMEVVTAGGADVKALSGRVPSLVIESSFGRAFPRFYIRGLGNTDFDLNASQPVSMIYDEVVLENPVLKGMPVWDIDRVEVLRGPQGTLFGRNTPAGIVKFESKKPSQTRDAYAQLSYGTFGTADLRGAIGGGFTPTLSGRFSYLYQTQDDWVDNGRTRQNNALGGYTNWAGRFQLLWEPNDRFRALGNVHAWDVDGTARIFRANIFQKGSNSLVPGFDQETVFHDGLNEQTISSHGLSVRLDYDLTGGTITSVTAYDTLDMFSRGDIDGGFGASFAPPFGPGFIPFNSESSDGIPELTQFTQEIRFATNTQSPLQWLAGLFLFSEDLEAETRSYTSIAPGNPQEGFATQQQDADSWALFGSFDYKVSDQWKLKGGLRFTHDEKSFSAERLQPLFFNTRTTAPVRANTDDDFVNWDLSAIYAVNPALNVYGRLATGSRAPSIQGRILFAPDSSGGTNPATNGLSVADTEELFSTEVGFKSELIERTLRLNGAIYRYSVDGQQMTAVGGQYNVATLLNADKTEGYGLEADINWLPAPEWLATLGVSYNHTEIDDPRLTVAPCGGGCTVLNRVANGLAFVDGNSLPHAPEWIINGIIDYRRIVGQGQVTSSLDWAYHSDKQFFLYRSEEFHADAFELGLRVGYTWANGKYGLAFFGRNLTDEVIVQNGIDFNNLTGMTNEPRMMGAELTIRF
ncbi:MAG TPA: TonB-dependent receptor [Thermoanaerobaculia bacterium]|nr:TonB-dependent receptor [Thermoanaerobaculia bacterium]